jgi:hypothetical protein
VNRVERIKELVQQKTAIDAELKSLKAQIKEETASLRKPRKAKE